MSDSEGSVFCGADMDDRFARHALRAMEAEMFRDSDSLKSDAEIEQLFQAIETANMDVVSKIVESNSSIVNCVSTVRHKNTPLHEAAERELVDVVACLLKNGANPEATNEFGLTPLALCAQDGNTFALIAQVAEIKENDRRGAVTRDAGFYSF